MDECVISVIIPVYNVAGYVETCIESILAQTFQNYEVIIVDDGSSDETGAIIDEYQKKDARIKVIHKKNEGVSVARNTGIAIAKGKYYLFYDGDDFVEPYAMQELYDIMCNEKVDTIIYGYHRYEQGKVKETTYPKFDKTLYLGEEIQNQILPRFIGLSNQNINQWLQHEEGALIVENPALWRSMVSADIIKNNRLLFNPNLKVGEDTLFISEYLSYANKCYIQQKCYYYLVTRETSTIFNYELNPMAKLDGKERLLQARLEFTQRYQERYGKDITGMWSGTIIMSCMELAFLLAKKNKNVNWLQRYKMLNSYIKKSEVQSMIRDFHVNSFSGIKNIPFFFLKNRWYFILYSAVSVLAAVHYEFDRK